LDVSGVKSGEEALEFLKKAEVSEKPVDIVVMDVKMPGMDGIQTLREVKKICPRTEVIMLTGHACLEVAREGMESGAFDYLMKPVDMDELLFKIQDAYKKKILQEKRAKGSEDK
jgi:YesN/AraC family two-component response regulator